MRDFFNDKEVIKQVFIFALSGIIVVAFFLALYNFSVIKSILANIIDVMMPFIWGIIFYMLLVNVANFIEKLLPKDMKKKRKRTLGSIGAIAFFILIVFIFFLILVPQIIASGSRLAGNMQSYIRDLSIWLDSLNISITDRLSEDILNFSNDFAQFLIKIVGESLPQIVTTVYSSVSAVFSFIIGLVICAYILLDRDNIHRQFLKLGDAFLSKKHVEYITTVLATALDKFNSFIRGQLLDALIVGVICFVAMSILHLEYAILISFICAVTNVIPVFGPFIGAIPSAFILLMVDPLQCLIFIIMIIVLQQIDGNIICPHILGDSIGLSKIWIMFAIIVGGGLFGIVGMFFGVPIFGLIYYFLNVWAQSRIEKKKLDETSSE